MKPLDAREWLEQRRVQGCDYASELLAILDALPDLEAEAEEFRDIRDNAPKEIRQSVDLWRVTEWIGDRLAVLGEVEDALAEHAADFTAGNGKPFDSAADKLQCMLNSPRWQQYDL
jgi:hypothetical protein